MSLLIPTNITSFTTPGERLFYRFLEKTPRPDSECLAWYSPIVDGKEPDFVLYTPEVGLIVFEVKDWVLSQILGGDQNHFRLLIKDREESRTNPQKQAREYIFDILNRIKNHGKPLVSTETGYHGKAKIPVQSCVVFTNILRSEFIEKGLDKILSVKKALFSDDIHSTSAFSMDETGGLFRKHLKETFSSPFSFNGLNRFELSALREVLWPEVRISLPKQKSSDSVDEEIQIRQLDLQQESLARRLDAKKAMIHGPAGSGKTLVLLHKAIAEFKRHAGMRPILVLCFNITLVQYLRHILSEHSAPLGRRGIQVMHFYQFCNSLLKEPLSLEEDGEYYEVICGLALDAAKNQGESEKYAAILVDEGQDFSDAMIAVLENMLAEDGMFWIAMDSGQQLYGKKAIWEKATDFRRFLLENPYRSSLALQSFCEKIVQRENEFEENEEALPECMQVNLSAGKAPYFQKIGDAEDGASYIAKRILELRKEGMPFSEMLVLYAGSRMYPELGTLEYPVFLQDYLEGEGILCTWVAKNSETKANWDCTTNRLAISTIHSMKGLDGAVVFVLGLDALEQKNISDDQFNTLAYVACSRARQELHILYGEESPWVVRMKNSL
ncbi:NERD domain-containing protein [Desulfococcaceae bacterium OttesenSCG-928-F15]|nr:NERD domain-containing protein [Desulfococcaceae bacterium OttesenSCG-928-F15]